MPKISSFISPESMGKEYTVVNSGAYGRHVRAKRGTHKPLVVTDAMKKAGELMRSANAHAKVINDAFKPFCKDMRDSTRWPRLVGLFRKQLQKGDVKLDELLCDFYFKRRRALSSVLLYSKMAEVTQPQGSGNTVVVKVDTVSAVKAHRNDPDKYEQIIIAVFLDADFRATVLTDTKYQPVSDKLAEHVATFTLPAGARRLIIAMKCIHKDQGKDCAGIPAGMSIVRIVEDLG